MPTVAAVRHDHRLVDQRADEIDDVDVVDRVEPADLLCSTQVEPAGEHGRPIEEEAFVFGEELVRPRNRGSQCLVPIESAAAAATEQAETVSQALEQFLG